MPRPAGHRFRVTEEDSGLRLDQLLARHVPGLSRGKARVLLGLGGVFVDRKRVKVAGRLLRPGQVVEAHLGAAFAEATAPQARMPASPGQELHVRLVDDHVIVVEKPAGLASAPTPESDRTDLLAWLVARYGSPVHVVQRLDRPTSGLLVYARTGQSAARLSAALQARTLRREYLVAVAGLVDFERREVTSAVRGKPAQTEFWCEERRSSASGGASRLRAVLTTGRTHQIRVHVASIGHPVLGDALYGGAEASVPPPPRLGLHAARLVFPHPETGALLTFESPWPEELAQWWRQLAVPEEPRDG